MHFHHAFSYENALVCHHHHHHHHYLFALVYNTFQICYSMLLGEETSGNHQAYRRGHLDNFKRDKGCEGVRQKLTQKLF